MTLETRNGSIIQDTFGLRSTTPPTLEAPVASVTQRYDSPTDITWLDVEITTPIVGADGYIITVIDAATSAIVGVGLIIGDVVEEAVRLPVVTVNTKRIFQIKTIGGLGYQESFVQIPITALEEVDPPVIAATKAGDLFIITPPVWSVTPIDESFTIEESDDDNVVDPWTALDPTPTHAPNDAEGKFYRVVFSATGPAGDGPITSASDSIGPLNALEESFDQVTPALLGMGDSIYWPTGGSETTWFKWTASFTGITGSVVQWTTTDPISFPNDGPDIDWKPTEEITPGVWVPVDVSLAADPTNGRPANFSVWRADPDSSDRQKLRIRQGDGVNWSAISLPSWFIEEPDEVPDAGNLVYRQYMRRAAAQYGVTPDIPELYEDGIFSGDCQQFFLSAAWSADGSKIACGQDSGQFIFSEDGGSTWFRPPTIGLKVFQIMALAADPNNTSRWLFAAGAGFQTDKDAAFSGIWVSDDDLRSATFLKNIPGIRDGQWSTSTITCYPASGGATAKWYVVVNPGKNVAAQFVKSGSNNGATWGSATSLAWATYGIIYKLQASPHTASTLFMGTEHGGLRRSTDDGATFPVMPGNLPSGQVRWFWIDPDNSAHMLCTLSTTSSTTYGLYETNNANSGSPVWSRIRQCPAVWADVGAKNSSGDRTIYVKCGQLGTSAANDTDHVRLQSGTWITRATSSPNNINFNIAGAQSNLQPFNGMCNPYSSFSNGTGHGWVHARPGFSDEFLVLGKTSLFKTTDQGKNVNLSSSGYGGQVVRSIHYDFKDKNLITLNCHDILLAKSSDGLKTTLGRLTPGGPIKAKAETILGADISSFTGRSVVRLPNNSSIAEADWRGRIIAGTSTSNGTSGVMFFVDEDLTYGDWMGANPTEGQSNATGGGYASRAFAGFLKHDPNKVWCGVNKIDLNAGTTWGVSQNNRSIIGAAHDGTDLIYGFAGSVIYRSTNFADSWNTLYTFAAPSPLNLGAPVGGCSEYDGRRMFFKHGHRAFKMIFDDAGVPDVTNFNLEGSIAGTTIFSTPYATDSEISDIVGDPLDERYIYIATETMGTDKRVFRLKFNSSFTDFSECVNITENGPTGASVITLFHTGLHGCLHTGHNGMGSYIFPSPVDWAPRVGWYKFSGQPSDNQTLVINGVTWTFQTSGAGVAETNIGANLSATLTQLAADLNASANASITPCTYTARYGNRLEVVMDSPTSGVDEPFPLTAGTTTNATVLANFTPCKDRMWLDCPLPIFEI